MMCDLACDEIAEHFRAVSEVVECTDLSPRGNAEGGKKSQDGSKGVKTAKPKECFCCVTPNHSKSEYKNLSAAVKQRFAQRGRANRHASEEVNFRVRRETVVERDKHGEGCSETGCFPHAGDDDPDEYSLALPVIEKSDDDYTSQMRSDVSAVEQVDPPAFKSDDQVEPSEEVQLVPNSST